MDLKLTDRVALVTGASKGIGLAVARTLAGEGARVVASSRSLTPELADLGVVHVAADLPIPRHRPRSSRGPWRRTGAWTWWSTTPAAPSPGSPLPHAGFLTRGDDDWAGIFELNLHAVVRICRAALPVLWSTAAARSSTCRRPTRASRRRSTPSTRPRRRRSPTWGTALSEEFAPQGVRVNTVSPGPVVTPWWTDAGGAAERFGAMVGADKDAVIATVAPEMMHLSTGRLATAQEVADAVAYLASPRSASTTGADLVVDGGLLKTA